MNDYIWAGLLNFGVIVLTTLGTLYLIHRMVRDGDELIKELLKEGDSDTIAE